MGLDQSKPESCPAGNSRDQYPQRTPLTRMKADSPAVAVNALHAPQDFCRDNETVSMRVGVALGNKENSPIPGEPFNLSMDEDSILATEQHDVTEPNFFWCNFAENGDVAGAHPRQHARTLHAQTNPAAAREMLQDASYRFASFAPRSIIVS
jgi:hypothetical protein